MKVYIGNDNLLTVDALTNAATGAYVNNATVTATLKDADGTNVSGQTWPLSLAYVSGSNGKYQGVLEDGLDLTEDNRATTHTCVIDIDAVGDQVGHFEIPMTATVRRS